MLMAGEGSGGAISAGREQPARVSLSVAGQRAHRTLAALLIQMALPHAERASAVLQKSNH
jgi:hypothetical protein